jgi:hypothetical protein
LAVKLRELLAWSINGSRVWKTPRDEPRSPRSLNDHIPRDLETICLKAMAKEAGRRYATAREFADDLRRWLNGEAIRARPVGRVERAARWARRNPALASMVAVVVLTLLTATAISTGFGIDARRQATDAIHARNDLAGANETLMRTADDLKRSRDDLKLTADDLERSRDDLETTLARSLLRPLGVAGGNTPLTAPEWEALWELATNRRGRLGYRFIEEASRTSMTTRQLRDRAALALPAAVGLDEERRAEIESLLLARLDDPALGEQQKNDLALVASAWDGLSSSAAVRTVRRLTRAMAGTRDPSALRQLAQGLPAVATRLEAKDAAITLAQAMKDTKDPRALVSLEQGLSAVAARLEAKDAAPAATTLAQAIKEDTKTTYALQSLARALSSVAARMEARDAATVTADAATALVQAMKDTKNPSALNALAQGLSSVLSAVPPADIPFRSATATAALAFPAGTGQPLTALALFIPAAEPPPCHLSTQQLVDLLKTPPFVGEARRVVLDQVGNRYHRPFADVWEFVRFAKEQDLDLDFTTPPQGPQPADSTH